MRIAKAALGFVGSVFGGSRSWWLLLAVAAAGAALYAWGAEGRADRDRLAAWGGTICASAASELQPDGRANGSSTVRGKDCAVAVARLAAFKRDSATATAELLAQAMRDQAEKARADQASAQITAREMRDAASMMEKVNAQVGPDDRVARDWFVALNRTGGLRAPGS